MKVPVAPVVLLAVAICLSAFVPAASAGVDRGNAHAGSALLYQANWGKGTLGWSADGGGKWDAVGGMLTYDGSGASTIISHFKIKPRQNYAIEATIQMLRHGDYNGNDGFGILARAYKPVDLFSFVEYGPGGNCCYSGFTAGMQGRSGYSDGHPNGTFASIWRSGIYAEELDSSDFDPGHAWHTYRVEVRANDIRLLVDGQPGAEVQSNSYLDGRRLGLFSMFGEISVGSFKVFSLP